MESPSGKPNLFGLDRAALAQVMGVVLVGEGHVVAVEGEQAMVADRHAMGIATEISQHGVGPAEGRFAVDDPIRREERIDESPPRRCVS